jgi:DNA-binding CsgD family transcriptional regulator
MRGRSSQETVSGEEILGQRLTSREREVLRWLARGKSNAEIGAILGISSATVGKHLEHIYPKLGVENRTAAASFATGLEE